MTVVDIKEMVRKDVPIYYRRMYDGKAVVEFAGQEHDMKINWTIETSPLGIKETVISMTEKIDYPLLPLIREIKKKIESLDSEGKLPL
jgi:hypothetical protein